MTEFLDIFKDFGHENWVKAALAVQITREALLNVVENRILKFQSSTLQNIRSASSRVPATCNSCETCQLLPCPTSGVCRNVRGKCKYHTTPPRPCSVGICDKLKAEIEANHCVGRPSWKDTDAKAWCTNHWQIAKCYMPSGGYCDVQTAEETDFNGIISVILNCRTFDYLRHSASSTDQFRKVIFLSAFLIVKLHSSSRSSNCLKDKRAL